MFSPCISPMSLSCISPDALIIICSRRCSHQYLFPSMLSPSTPLSYSRRLIFLTHRDRRHQPYPLHAISLPREPHHLAFTNTRSPPPEFLRGNAKTDECEPIFKQYKSCLGVALKDRGIDKMLEDAREDTRETDVEYIKPRCKYTIFIVLNLSMGCEKD